MRLSYVTAGRLTETIRTRFNEYGLPPLEICTNIIPPDTSTLFICAGMQPLKPRFIEPDGTQYGNIQSCIRTNDISEVGDFTHLTLFQMIGSFGFGTKNYDMHVDLWHNIVRDLNLSNDYREHIIVRCHPDSNHRPIWEKYGGEYLIMDDPSCQWSDGNVGGYCSEMFLNGVEIGNLVNPLEESIDVGFGFERLLQMLERKPIHETSLFRQDLSTIGRDHFRTLCLLWDNQISPGNKGRNYVCRWLLRRFMREYPTGCNDCPFMEWVESERPKREKNLREGKRYFNKHGHQSPEFWWNTFGLLPEEVSQIERE